MLSDTKKKLLEIIKRDALTKGDFTLASGKKSSYYIDMKKAILKPEGAYLSARAVLEMLPEDISAVGGVPLGAVPVVSAMVALSFVEKRQVDGFLIRKQAKGYGTNKCIEGEVTVGSKVALIEDVVTTGGSVVSAAEKIREYGLEVVKIIALVDREEGGAELIRSSGFDFDPVFSIHEILE